MISEYSMTLPTVHSELAKKPTNPLFTSSWIPPILSIRRLRLRGIRIRINEIGIADDGRLSRWVWWTVKIAFETLCWSTSETDFWTGATTYRVSRICLHLWRRSIRDRGGERCTYVQDCSNCSLCSRQCLRYGILLENILLAERSWGRWSDREASR